ncbi:helix-turn-helix transcriptional regulator [Corynebacterium sp. UBA2622]|uniref:helix-turn-helix transcriptional regulator n=1 Tax=Corynebacterium sp. UBA2622 TaxID=1946393 RepID=UPI0025BAFB31|nr:helix-turn-helix transcriptional regulator [Corynebacterium sp. UBA2622]
MSLDDLGEFIRTERKKRGLVQAELAELAGVSERFVRECEKGKPTAEIGKVMALFSVLGFDLVPAPHVPEALR